MLKPEDIIECCMTCKYLAYSSCSDDRAYCSGQKDVPHIVCPDNYVCDRYKSFVSEPKEKEPTEENKMDANVTKDIKVTQTVFNRDFWIPEDIYILENIQAKKRFVCVFMNFEDNDSKIRIWINSQGYAVLGTDQLDKTFRVVKHITQESLIEDC